MSTVSAVPTNRYTHSTPDEHAHPRRTHRQKPQLKTKPRSHTNYQPDTPPWWSKRHSEADTNADHPPDETPDEAANYPPDEAAD
jgi:hypothetical protein